MNIEALTQPTQISIHVDNFEIELDHWIGTIRVQVGTGDITHQRTQAIVNAANSHLNHFGGVGRAIADAAGKELINECEVYKQKNGILPISSVMLTTAGNHTVGPCDIDYSDKDELLKVRTSTHYNVIKYSCEILRLPTLAVPAISGGIFQVKLENVGKAFYTALKQYTDEYGQTSHTPILQRVPFVHNSHAITTTAAYLFKKLYISDRQQPTVNSTPTDMPAPLPRPSGRQANRRRRSDKRVEERMQIWTPDLLRQKQE